MNFIVENGFFVDIKDEMTEIQQNGLVGRLDPTFALAFGIATTILLASSFFIARQWRRRLEMPRVPAPPKS